MLNPNATSALKRVIASLLGMGQTRLELAGVELAQFRQTTVRTVVWSLLTALAAALASMFACVLVIALVWDTHRLIAIAGCAAFYVVLGVYFYSRLKDTLSSQSPLFEATLAELERDKLAVLNGLSDDGVRAATQAPKGGNNEQKV